jgi:hypothetical protein
MLDPVWYVIQRINAYGEWDDVAMFESYGKAHEVYLTKTPFRWHRIIKREGSMNLIVR